MASIFLALALTGQVFPTATSRPAPRSTVEAAGKGATKPTGRDAAADPPARPTLKLKAPAAPTDLAPPPDGGPSLPPPAPTVYRQADATGQIWTHADPSWLAQWIAQRNSAMVVYPPPVTYAPRVMSPCGPRGCPRR